MTIFNAVMGPLSAFAPADIVDTNVDDNNCIGVVYCAHFLIGAAKMEGSVKVGDVLDGRSMTTWFEKIECAMKVFFNSISIATTP